MTLSIEKDTLIALEFELNRKDILHCRSLIASTVTSEEFSVLAPAQIEHGYVFKAGDRIDIYASLLSHGDADHALHIKTRVLQVEKTDKGPQLHLKSTGFCRRTSQVHLYTLRSKASLLIEPTNPSGIAGTVTATLHSVSPSGMHITTAAPLKRGSRWKAALVLDGVLFDVEGKAEPSEGKNAAGNGYSSMISFIGLPHDTQLKMAGVIDAVQKKYIQTRAGLSLHDIHQKADIQDALILEHLVPRSWHRIALDLLEVLGWGLLILAFFDSVLAAPPETTFFDRVFQLNPEAVWNKEQLNRASFLLTAELMIFICAFSLHQFIYYRGNTHVRWRLWAMSFLSLLLYMSVRTHL